MNLFDEQKYDYDYLLALKAPRPTGCENEIADQEIRWLCKCGARWVGHATRSALPWWKREWDHVHSGPGHGLVHEPKDRKK